MEGSIARCEDLVAGLRVKLANPDITESDREMMQAEMKRHDAMLNTRRGQLQDLLIVPKPETTSLSRDAARDLEDALRSATDDMQNDLRAILFKHGQLNRERAKVFRLRETLEARKKWLEEHHQESAATKE